jgi:hemolysin activation/secretion protein
MKVTVVTIRFILSFLLSYFYCSQTVLSQSIPQPIPPASEPLPEPELLPPPEELLQPLSPPQTPEKPQLEIPGTITVTEFNFVGSTVFTSEQLQAVLQDYLNRPPFIYGITRNPNSHYPILSRSRLYTSGAILPPQTLNDGIVTLEIIEGEVEEIQISGLERLQRVIFAAVLNVEFKRHLIKISY